jgi:hypothetical protein
MRYVLQHPGETRPSLLVEVVDETDPGVLARVRDAMLSVGCANAMVIDPRKVHVLRDTFKGMTEASIEEETTLETERLLGRSDELAARVRRWLESMSTNWSETLPREDWVAPLFYDIVPAASGSVIRRVEPDAA